MKSSAHPNFENPPIVEIGIGVAFSKPERLSIGQLGRFWATIAGDFPYSEDHNPVGSPAEWAASVEGLPLPRLWVIAAGGNTLLQLQVDRFGLNWRRQKDSDRYPDFASRLEAFLGYWKLFCEFAQEVCGGDAAVRSAEIIKVSRSHETDGWAGFEEMAKVCSAVSWPASRDEWKLKHVALNFGMEHRDGKGRFELKSASATADPSRRLLLTEIRVEPNDIRSTLSDLGNLEERLWTGNELANLIFTTFAPLEIQQNAWQRTS
ncbi:MAG: hypothetical protein U1F09_02100 [Steroidobacteraceae bacterium]